MFVGWFATFDSLAPNVSISKNAAGNYDFDKVTLADINRAINATCDQSWYELNSTNRYRPCKTLPIVSRQLVWSLSPSFMFQCHVPMETIRIWLCHERWESEKLSCRWKDRFERNRLDTRLHDQSDQWSRCSIPSWTFDNKIRIHRSLGILHPVFDHRCCRCCDWLPILSTASKLPTAITSSACWTIFFIRILNSLWNVAEMIARTVREMNELVPRPWLPNELDCDRRSKVESTDNDRWSLSKASIQQRAAWDVSSLGHLW